MKHNFEEFLINDNSFEDGMGIEYGSFFSDIGNSLVKSTKQAVNKESSKFVNKNLQKILGTGYKSVAPTSSAGGVQTYVVNKTNELPPQIINRTIKEPIPTWVWAVGGLLGTTLIGAVIYSIVKK